ncbi:MAG TPA: peptidylprolyl isomerase [Verrucomicrobiae bacterium]|nr:peptidylprolyl isomerase [Verrucomicrobiae bacterium]
MTDFWPDPSIAVMLKARCVVLLIALIAGVGHCKLHAEFANGVKVVVDEAAITHGEIESDVRIVAGELLRQYGRQPALYNQKVMEAAKDSMERAVQQQLILHDYRTMGYSIPESIIEEVVQEQIKSRFGDRATLRKTLQAQGITYEKWRQQEKDRFIVQQLRLKNIFQEAVVSPYKIERYYMENKTDYKVEDQVKLRMVTLTNVASEADIEQSRKLAEEIITKVKEGVPFSEMAQTYSDGVQRIQGGDWGWVERTVLRKELAEVAFSLKPGEVSGVIETPQAIYVLFVEDRRMAHNKPLADVQAEIEKTLMTEEREKRQKQYIDKLRKKTFVRYF